VRLLLDEMYPAALAEALGEIGIDVVTVAELRLTGAPDPEVFAAARAARRAVLTENVADFTRLAAEHVTSGGHHAGLLIALSSRFSRRPAGMKPLAAAIHAVADENLDDRVVYLQPPSGLS
jgi:hypothetical protein